MPTQKVFSRLEHFFTALETTYGTAVAPSAAGLYLIKFDTQNTVNLLRRRDKTGSRTKVHGIRGRASAKWSYEGSLYGSGAAGTIPDADVLFQLIFGQAGTVAAGSSVTYTLADAILSASLWSYRQPSDAEQRVVTGAIATDFTFTLGQDIAEYQINGMGKYMLGSSNFASMDTTQKSGLSSFPAMPASPTYADGGAIAGFTGSITIDGQSIAHLRSATIKGKTGNAIVTDEFGTYYPVTPEGDEREFTFGFNCYEDDSTGLATIKEASDSKTPVDATIQIGTVAGNTFTFTVKGIQLESPNYDDSGRSYVNNFPDSLFTGSAPAALDELKLVIS